MPHSFSSDHLPRGIAFGPNTCDLGVSAPLPEFGQSYGLGVGIRTHPGLSPVPGGVTVLIAKLWLVAEVN